LVRDHGSSVKEHEVDDGSVAEVRGQDPSGVIRLSDQLEVVLHNPGLNVLCLRQGPSGREGPEVAVGVEVTSN
jgi:hypothetical protein